MARALEALIFDVDGTLADTERDAHRVAFNLAFADAGFDWDWDIGLYGELLRVAGGKERILHYLERFQPGRAAEFARGGRLAALHEAKTAHYLRLVERGAAPLRPGVKRLLGDARAAGIALAIATTTSEPNVRGLLAATLGGGAQDWFKAIGAGDVVRRKKPDPAIYHWVLERLGLPAAACLAIEDSENGLRASLAAGIATLVTTNHYTRGEDFSGASALLPGLGEPEAPFSARISPVHGRGWVDVAFLRALHASRPR